MQQVELSVLVCVWLVLPEPQEVPALMPGQRLPKDLTQPQLQVLLVLGEMMALKGWSLPLPALLRTKSFSTGAVVE